MSRFPLVLLLAACTPSSNAALLAATNCGSNILCNAVCVNPLTSATNCGACGHVCADSGTCTAGMCAVTVLATQASHATALVAAGTKLYWADNGQIFSIDTAQAGAPVVVTSGAATNVRFLATDGATIFFPDTHESLVATPVSGGTSVVISDGAHSVNGGITADDINVYWVSGSAVVFAPKAGGAIGTLVSNLNTPWALSNDTQNVYATFRGTRSTSGLSVGANDAGVVAVNKQTLTAAVLAATVADAVTVSTDSAKVYFGGEALDAVPITGGGATTVWANACASVMADATGIYASGASEIVAKHPSDAAAFRLYEDAGAGSVQGIAIDDKYVYALVNAPGDASGVQLLKVSK